MFAENFKIYGTLTSEQILSIYPDKLLLIPGIPDKVILVENVYLRLLAGSQTYHSDSNPNWMISPDNDRQNLCVFGNFRTDILTWQFNTFAYLKRKEPYPYGVIENYEEDFIGQDLYLHSFGRSKFYSGNGYLEYRLDCIAFDPTQVAIPDS